MPIQARLSRLGVLGALALALAAACGGDDAAPRDGGRPMERRSLTDCEYAKALEDAVGTYVAALSRATQGSTGASAGEVRAAFGAFDTETDRLVSELQAYALSPDMRSLNDGFISLFRALKEQTGTLRDAATAGDATRVSALVGTLGADLVTRAETIQRENPAGAAKLEACRTG